MFGLVGKSQTLDSETPPPHAPFAAIVNGKDLNKYWQKW